MEQVSSTKSYIYIYLLIVIFPVCRDYGAPQGIEIDYGIGGNFAYLKGEPATIGFPKMTMNCQRHHIPFILICKRKEGHPQSNDGAWI